MSGKRGTSLARFETKFLPEPNSGCWLWEGAQDAKGYGQFFYPPRNMVDAHVVAYELYKGSRQGLYVLHRCDTPCCVNPDHLELGTQQENVRQRDARQRRAPPQGDKNGRALLTDTQVMAIRNDPRWPRFIAKDYCVTSRLVQRIKRRETWAHLP